jgi:hypothetical protein
MQVFRGDAAAGSARLGIDRQFIVVNRDCLSVGPCGPLDDLERWREQRENFWASVARESALLPLDELLPRREEVLRASSIVVWAGSGLDDQLFLSSTVVLLINLGVPLERIALPEVSPKLRSLGEAAPRAFDGWRNRLHPLTAEHVEAIQNAWAAFTSSSPEHLVAWLAAPPAVLPHLAPALRCILERFPQSETGLGSLDERLLLAVRRRGPKAVSVIASCIEEHSESLDFPGDLTLFWRLRRLSARPQPLVDLGGSGPEMRHKTVQLTAIGEAVLEGKQNHVLLSGIDEWIGGVHLEGDNVWWRRGGKLSRSRT